MSLAVLVLVLSLPVAAQGPVVRVTSCGGYPSTLAHLADQLSGAARSRQGYYLKFWGEHYAEPEDAELLRAYQRARRAFEAGDDERPTEGPMPRGPASDPRGPWFEAFCDAAVLDDALRRLRPRLSAEDADTVARTLEALDRRFRPYWRGVAGQHLEQGRRFEERWKEKVEKHLTRTARFLGVPGVHVFRVALVWQPALEYSAGASSGESFGPMVAVQLPEGRTVETQLDVIVHEAVHGLFRAMPDTRFDSIAEGLIRRDPDFGLLSFNWLTEGIPTALGQGLFVQEELPEEFSLERSWYDGDADRFAKTIHGPTRAAVLGAAGMDDVWLDAVSAAVRAEYGAKPPLLREHFRNRFLAFDSASKPIRDRIGDVLPSNGTWLYALDDPRERPAAEAKLARHWALPAVLLATPGSLTRELAACIDPDLSDRVDALRERDGLVLYAGRSAKGRPYLVLLGNEASLGEAMPILSEAPAIWGKDLGAAGAVK